MKRVVAAVIKAEWFDFLLVEVGSIACEDTPPSQIKTYPKFHIVKGTNEIPNLQPIFFNNFSARADAFKGAAYGHTRPLCYETIGISLDTHATVC